MSSESKFDRWMHCPICDERKLTKRAMCVDCGTLIGCHALCPNETEAYHGCQDNGILLEEIMKLSRHRDNLISSLYQIMMWESGSPAPKDYLINQAILDLQQIAKNTLKDYGIDEDNKPKIRL